MRATLLCLLVLAMFCGTTLACSCRPKTEQLQYCEADFAMEVNVSSELSIPGGPGGAFYHVEIIGTPWKFPDGESVRWNNLYTESNGALCGVTWLQKGTKYFVSGSYDLETRKMKINLCGLNIPTTPVPTWFKTWQKSPPICQKTTP